MFTLVLAVVAITVVVFSIVVVNSNRNERNAQFLRDWDTALSLNAAIDEQRRNAFYRSFFHNETSHCFNDGSMRKVYIGNMWDLEKYGLDISMPSHREKMDLLLSAEYLTTDNWQVPQGHVYAWFSK